MSLPVGDRVTLQTLADQLGISRTTASNAFNRPDQLNPALREKVLALAAELGYAGPDPAGRALRSGRAGAIGVLLTEQLSYAFGDPAAVATLRGLAEEAEQFGISLSLLPAPLTDGVADPAAVRHALVDACFVYALPAGHPSVNAALERHLPLVVCDTPHMPGVPFVSIDDRGGARAAAQHLLDLGHRRLAVVSLRMRDDGRRGFVDEERRCDPVYRVTAERLTGYEEAFATAGLSWRDVPIYEVDVNARALAREAVPALLEGAADRDPRHVRRARAGRDRRRRRHRRGGPARPLGRRLRRRPARRAARADHRAPAARREGPRRGADAARGDRRRDARRRLAPDRARRARLDHPPLLGDPEARP